MADLEAVEGRPDSRPAADSEQVIEPSPPPTPGEEKVMSLVDHLAELRRRLAIVFLAVVGWSIAGFLLAPRIVDLLTLPIGDRILQVLEVGGLFFLYLKIALLFGVVASIPVILYHVWAFVAPGLTPRERGVARPWVILTPAFFALGVIVAYLILPFAIGFLFSFELPGVVENRPSAKSYFDFVLLLFLAFGLVMQFPIVLVVLNKLGLVSVERLRASRRYALLGIIIFAVVATPGGDPVSPVAMGGVMYLLYELTIALLARSAKTSPAADG